MKVLRVTFSNGEVFDIPASQIATDRASYYAAKDKDTSFRKEYEHTLSDNGEILDWSANNMNWRDVKSSAERFASIPVNYDEEWTNAEKKVVEK